MVKKRRIINIRVLPGQPLDGSGRVCIHLFIQDEKGPFVEPYALHPVIENGEQVKQQVTARPTRGRLACDPKRDASPVTNNGVITVTLRTDNPDAVTCPKCLESTAYIELVKRIESIKASVPATQ